MLARRVMAISRWSIPLRPGTNSHWISAGPMGMSRKRMPLSLQTMEEKNSPPRSRQYQ